MTIKDKIALKAERNNFQIKLINWFDKNGRNFPWRINESPYSILIAEICLRLTGAWKAVDGYKEIMNKYRDLHELASANLNDLKKIFEPLGLMSRAENLVYISRELNKKYNGEIPSTYDELVEIKGIGKYTANAILCFAFNKRKPIVDRNVKRLYERYFGYRSEKPPYNDKALWEIASYILTYKYYKEYNMAILDFPAVVCKHYNPECKSCILKSNCAYFNEIIQDEKD